MRSIERNSAVVRFRPPNLAVAPSLSTRPRRAFSTVRGCSKNFLEHEVRVFAAHGVLLADFQVADLDVGGVGAEIQNIEASGVMVATS